MRQETNCGDIVRKFRTGHRMKQITLGAHLNVDENYIYMVEKGLRVPSLKFILEFARLVQVNPEWLFEKWIRDFLIREEEKTRERFQKMVSKKSVDFKLPSPPPPERFDKKSLRVLRPEWDTALKRIPMPGATG